MSCIKYSETIDSAAHAVDVGVVIDLIANDPVVGWEVLEKALHLQNSELIGQMIPFLKPNGQSWRSMQLAAKLGLPDVVSQLIPVANTKLDYAQGFRAAATNGHVEVLRVLLPWIEHEMDYNFAILQAAENGCMDIIKLLYRDDCQWGARSTVSIALKYRELCFANAFFVAESCGHEDIADLLCGLCGEQDVRDYSGNRASYLYIYRQALARRQVRLDREELQASTKSVPSNTQLRVRL